MILRLGPQLLQTLCLRLPLILASIFCTIDGKSKAERKQTLRFGSLTQTMVQESLSIRLVTGSIRIVISTMKCFSVPSVRSRGFADLRLGLSNWYHSPIQRLSFLGT